MKKIMMLLTVCIISTQIIAQNTKPTKDVPPPPAAPVNEIIEFPPVPPAPRTT